MPSIGRQLAVNPPRDHLDVCGGGDMVRLQRRWIGDNANTTNVASPGAANGDSRSTARSTAGRRRGRCARVRCAGIVACTRAHRRATGVACRTISSSNTTTDSKSTTTPSRADASTAAAAATISTTSRSVTSGPSAMSLCAPSTDDWRYARLPRNRSYEITRRKRRVWRAHNGPSLDDDVRIFLGRLGRRVNLRELDVAIRTKHVRVAKQLEERVPAALGAAHQSESLSGIAEGGALLRTAA